MKVWDLIAMLGEVDRDSTLILSEITKEDKIVDFTITEQRVCYFEGRNGITT